MIFRSRLMFTSLCLAILLPFAASSAEIARGIVFEDRNGNRTREGFEPVIQGVRVSNGKDIVTTNFEGRYELQVGDDTTIFVIKPSGFRTPLDENRLPQFYYTHKPQGSPKSLYPGVAPTGSLPESIDFPLYRQPEPQQFKAILFGDPQPRDQKELDYIAHDVVEELIGTDASFGVTLGDIVFDDLSLFEPQARVVAMMGIPWHNVIGNHDLNFDAPDDKHSDESFERVFGPSYYAFNYGPVHFLVLDDVEWFVPDGETDGTYRGGIGDDQLEFISRDLALIPDSQLVVLMMHIPLGDVGNREKLFRLIEKRPFCMSISAHTHTHEHRLLTTDDGWRGNQPHHHVVNVTVSGAWWSGAPDERGIPHTTMTDGGPNGYSIIDFDGQKYRLTYKAAGRPADYQLAIYLPEEIAANQLTQTNVWVNVFSGSDRSTAEFRIDRGTWLPLAKTTAIDPRIQRVFDAEESLLNRLQLESESDPWRKMSKPKPSTHLWTAALPEGIAEGTHDLEVRTRDMHGRVYADHQLFRVAPPITDTAPVIAPVQEGADTGTVASP